MVPRIPPSQFQPSQTLWDVLTRLISPDQDLRRSALDELPLREGFPEQPLPVYLLATRLKDPDLEIRFQAVKMIGDLLAGESDLPIESAEKCLAGYFAGFDKSDYIRLLEVSAAYLAAEDPLGRILNMCSYAGKPLSGIVNDRKLPVEIRQQAIFFCGEIGFLSTTAAIRNLIERVEKGRQREHESLSRQRISQEQEALYLPALAALSKLEG